MSARAWKCPECGFEMKDGALRICTGCGYLDFGRIVLEGTGGSTRTTASIDTEIGKRLLEKLVGEDARYASTPQFFLKRDTATGRWTVSHASDAKNPTFLNNAPLAGGAVDVSDGDVISIGSDRARVHVRIEL